MTDQSRFSMSDEAKLAAWNETLRRMKAAEQMVEDLRENVRTLVAERDAAERDRRRLSLALAEHLDWMVWTTTEAADEADTDAEVARVIHKLKGELYRDQLAAPPGMQERVAERLGLTDGQEGDNGE